MAENDNDQVGEDFTLEESPSHLLHRAQQFAAVQSASALQEAGITLRQFSVLAAVSEQEGASQSRLVDRTGIDRSTLADMVQRMETKSGLIRRAPSKEDMRAKSVFLTAKGRRALLKAAPAVRSADEKLLATLRKNQRGPFLNMLATFSPTADKPADDDAAENMQAKPNGKDTEKADKKDKPKAKAKAKDKGDKPEKTSKSKAAKAKDEKKTAKSKDKKTSSKGGKRKKASA